MSTYIDLRGCSFDEFVNFLFSRDTPLEGQKRDPWYWHAEADFDPLEICAYYDRLFRQPKFLIERFSKPQLEQAFWAIPGQNLNCSAGNLIWNTEVPFPRRQECVQSMSNLFSELFASEPLETSVEMWWDALCYDWHCGNRLRERGGEDQSMQNVMFETLRSILGQNSEICQGAALHGLGHLHHPDTPQLIEDYITAHPELTKEWRDYAIAASRFDVL
jgi:hypothetical protein